MVSSSINSWLLNFINEIIGHVFFFFLSLASFVEHCIFETVHAFVAKHGPLPLQCSIPLHGCALETPVVSGHLAGFLFLIVTNKINMDILVQAFW